MQKNVSWRKEKLKVKAYCLARLKIQNLGKGDEENNTKTKNSNVVKNQLLALATTLFWENQFDCSSTNYKSMLLLSPYFERLNFCLSTNYKSILFWLRYIHSSYSIFINHSYLKNRNKLISFHSSCHLIFAINWLEGANIDIFSIWQDNSIWQDKSLFTYNWQVHDL